MDSQTNGDMWKMGTDTSVEVDRRKFVRVDSQLPLSYTVIGTDQRGQSKTRNISGGGICFFAPEPLTPGAQIDMTMRLPGRDEPIRFSAEVVWSRLVESPGLASLDYRADVGVRFVTITPRDRVLILQHVLSSIQPF